MRRRPSPLLCELHAHTTWSDGALSVRELVDLYGRAGFDVLTVTDHVLRPEEPGRAVGPDQWLLYLTEIACQADRARVLYDLLVLPGIELTWNEPDVARSAHAVAVGIERPLSLANGLEAAVRQARDGGAGVIAAHPYRLGDPRSARRGTEGWADEELRALAHRFELINRHDVFDWIAEAKLPTVATGDFHRLEHLATWKTLLPCEKSVDSVLDYLRSARPAYLVRLDDPSPKLLAA
jgi:predicted metal-dependent phosphoesterase TrpH